MIPRYSREKMSAIWGSENRYRKWLEIELLACEALAKKGVIPKASLATIKKKAAFDVARIDEIEKTTKHDVIAFLTSVVNSSARMAALSIWGLPHPIFSIPRSPFC